MLSCQFCGISKNTFFYRTPLVAASAVKAMHGHTSLIFEIDTWNAYITTHFQRMMVPSHFVDAWEHFYWYFDLYFEYKSWYHIPWSATMTSGKIPKYWLLFVLITFLFIIFFVFFHKSIATFHVIFFFQIIRYSLCKAAVLNYYKTVLSQYKYSMNFPRS